MCLNLKIVKIIYNMDGISFKSLDNLIADLQFGVNQIKEGKLPAEEFNKILQSARLLHERLAILQYLTEKKSNNSSSDSNIDDDLAEKNQINLLDAIDEQEDKDEKENQLKEGSKFDSSSEQTVNEIHSSSPQTSLADHFGQQPIQDLTSEIGINERFLLTENLFNSDSNAYLNAINELNNFSNYEEALKYFKQELAKKLNWNLKNNHVKRFIKLVERRYQ